MDHLPLAPTSPAVHINVCSGPVSVVQPSLSSPLCSVLFIQTVPLRIRKHWHLLLARGWCPFHTKLMGILHMPYTSSWPGCNVMCQMVGKTTNMVAGFSPLLCYTILWHKRIHQIMLCGNSNVYPAYLHLYTNRFPFSKTSPSRMIKANHISRQAI